MTVQSFAKAMARSGLLAMLLGVSLPAVAAFNTDGCSWRRPITGPPNAVGYVRLPLPLEVLDVAQASLADLRVISRAGDLVPSIVYRSGEPEERHFEWKDVPLLNPVYQPEQYSRITADFGEPLRKNRIKVDTSGENYRRRILVEGSSDGQSWDIILENGWLFHVPLPGAEYRVNELSLPLNDFRYIRATVYNMPDDPRRIEINSIQLGYWPTVVEEPPIPVELKTVKSLFDEKTKTSSYESDLGYRNVPVLSVGVAVADPLFYRAYELSGRNASTETVRRPGETHWEEDVREAPWVPISSGVLFRMEHEGRISESTAVRNLDAPYRYLRLRVFEQDNPPLRIDSFVVGRRDVGLIFERRSEAGESLMGGNPEATPPSFDLVQVVGDLKRRTLPRVALGPPDPVLAEPRAVPWAERYGVVLWAALIAAVGAAAVLIARNLGRLRDA